MLLNITNHPSGRWSENQKKIAHAAYGRVIDIPFPQIDPNLGHSDIIHLAKDLYSRLLRDYGSGFVAHIMGEMTFTFALVSFLKASGIVCVASTTRRVVRENPDGTITKSFEFVRFRAY